MDCFFLLLLKVRPLVNTVLYWIISYLNTVVDTWFILTGSNWWMVIVSLSSLYKSSISLCIMLFQMGVRTQSHVLSSKDNIN